MIRINETNRRRDDKSRIKGARGSAQVSETRGLFSAELQSRIESEIRGSLDGMMNDLKEREQSFLNEQSMYELVRYKALVTRIIKTALSESLQVSSLKRTKKGYEDFTVVREINDKMKQITEAVMKSNKAFDLMKTIEEIRGLILDLTY